MHIENLKKNKFTHTHTHIRLMIILCFINIPLNEILNASISLYDCSFLILSYKNKYLNI